MRNVECSCLSASFCAIHLHVDIGTTNRVSWLAVHREAELGLTRFHSGEWP